jgi:hypothetical protein
MTQWWNDYKRLSNLMAIYPRTISRFVKKYILKLFMNLIAEEKIDGSSQIPGVGLWEI